MWRSVKGRVAVIDKEGANYHIGFLIGRIVFYK
jgi:hypothetical protein